MHVEQTFKAATALAGVAASYLWGGWTSLLGILLALVIIDFVTGLMASAIEGRLSSNIGFLGIPRKITIFLIVAVAHLVDVALGNGNMVRDATIFFYLANELISIIENSGRIGLPVPDPIKNAVAILKGKEGGK